MGIVLMQSLFSIFPFAPAWGHSGLWNITGSFQHCRRSNAQETSLAACMSLACAPQALQCLWEKGE